jgi:hypothetical protein
MNRGFVLALAAALCACAPAPVRMPPAQAAEVLNLFSSGRGPANICTPDGRALLRGAVRAYGREMGRSGVAWPAIPGASGEADDITHVEVSVLISYAAGFVYTTDFQPAARRLMSQLTFSQLPEILSLRRAARVACGDVQSLQQAAARYFMEQTRMEQMMRSAQSRSRGAETADRLRRQSNRLQRARADMEMYAEIVAQRMAENPVLPPS